MVYRRIQRRLRTLALGLALTAAPMAGANEPVPGRADEAASLGEPRLPLVEVRGTRWYGWQTALLDALAIPILAGELGHGSPLLMTPIVHAANDQGAAAAASTALRVGLILAYVDTRSDPGESPAGLRLLVMGLGMMAVDALLVAWTEPVHALRMPTGDLRERLPGDPGPERPARHVQLDGVFRYADPAWAAGGRLGLVLDRIWAIEAHASVRALDDPERELGLGGAWRPFAASTWISPVLRAAASFTSRVRSDDTAWGAWAAAGLEAESLAGLRFGTELVLDTDGTVWVSMSLGRAL